VLLGDGKGGFSAATNFSVGTSPKSIALSDVNRDGNLDIAVANAGSNNVSVLLGDGTGNFSADANLVAVASPEALAVSDFNGDGKPDLAVVNATGVSLLLGDGQGDFLSSCNVALTPVLESIALADFDGDQNLDLAVASATGITVMRGDGVGNLITALPFSAGPNPTSLAAGDFNGDLKPDLAVANFCALSPSASRHPRPSNTPALTMSSPPSDFANRRPIVLSMPAMGTVSQARAKPGCGPSNLCRQALPGAWPKWLGLASWFSSTNDQMRPWTRIEANGGSLIHLC
jgi:hypothetical protein